MSETLAAVHVRGAGRAAVLAEVERGMGRRGLEVVASPSPRERMLVRLRLRERGAWVSLAIEGLSSPDEWARALARELGTQALGAWYWDGEATTALTLFEGAARAVRLSLPQDARRAPDGRVVIPLGGLSRLVGKGEKKKRLEILARDDEASFDEDGRCVYLSDASHALQRALGIEELFLDPLDEDAGEEIIYFRPKASSAIAKRLRAEEEETERERRANHDGRLYTVGWLVFDVRPRDLPRVLAATARPIVEAMTPHLGARVLLARAVVPSKGETELPPPSAGDQAWKAYAKALRGDALIGLGRKEAPILASAWLVLRDGALAVGWCMRGLKDGDKRRALARTMGDVVAASVEDAHCFGALITSQRTPMSIEQQALAYEYLRGTSAAALRPATYRTRPRAPGWRVLIPAAPAGTLPRMTGVDFRGVRAGVLVASSAADPHEMTPEAMDALEAYLRRT